MCGIAGVFGTDDKTLVTDMVSTFQNRGPDHKGFATTDIAVLGNARLSIIDVAGSDQPIWDEQGQVCIVANCEIYNFKSVKATLLEKGHHFMTNGDTEVILQAYLEYGLDFAQYIDGIFAVAILDLNKKRLVLARDRLGIKPLYYTFVKDKLLFASEIKAILKFQEITPTLNYPALQWFLELGYISGVHSLFEGIQQLLPGTVMSVDPSGKTMKKYFKLQNGTTGKLDINILDTLIDEAVNSQLISERPLGIYLSGGLDSSIVASYAAKHLDKVMTFTQNFGEVNETANARLLSEQIGAEHFTLNHDPDTEIRDVRKMLYFMEHPTFGMSATYELAQFAKSKGNVVMLSGLGGDEIFGGYVQHARAAKISAFPNIPLLSRSTGKLFESFNQMKLSRYAYSMGSTLDKIRAVKYSESPKVMKALISKEFREVPETEVFNYNPNKDFFKVMESELIYGQLDGNYLKIADRMSMAASIEMRVPFLDTPLLQYSLNLPRTDKIRNNVSKFGLRKLAGEQLSLPKQIIKKGEDASNKGGYGFSAAEFWKESLGEYVKTQLDSSIIREYKVFDENQVKNYLSKVRSYAQIRTLWHIATTHELIDIFQMQI